jgi:allophanate hydrolase
MYTVAELEADPIVLNSNLGSYTNFVNLLDLSAISVPAGMRGDGLPSSLTLVGKAGADGYLAGIARAVEGAAELAPKATPGRIEVAVVGAHLSGLPLNHELTNLGGTFVRAGETAAEYSLHALATTPAKPGMVRVTSGGSRIAVEVWSLDAEGFGRFVAGIPAPLSIGTVTLADGSTPKGFLAEAAAVADAEDISRYGGWRAYLGR